MIQYFQVGEEVVIQSKINTKHNGETGTVLRAELIRHHYCNGGTELKPPNFIYDVSGFDISFIQDSLKKKPKPSSESFEQLVESLNSVDVD